MSIRYYLLLLAGLITTLVMVGSFFIDSIILNENIHKARQEAATILKEVNEEKRKQAEDFLSTQIAEKLAQVNAMLEAISRFDSLTEWFAPTEDHKKKGTWNSSANLLQQDEWIEFLQNTTDGKLLSLIVPQKGPFFEVKTIPQAEGLAWVYILGSPAYEMPFLGVQVPIKLADETLEEVSSIVSSGVLPTAYLLYTPSRLKQYPLPNRSQGEVDVLAEQLPFSGGIEVDENLFWSYLAKAIACVNDPSLQIPPPLTSNFPLVEEKSRTLSFAEILQENLAKTMTYDNELFLLWQASVLKEMGVFGSNGDYWPEAMSFSVGATQKTQAVFIASSLDFTKPVFDDAAFFKKNQPTQMNGHVSSGSYVVPSPHENQAFLVNTAELKLIKEEGAETSFLSIGFDLKPFLEYFVSGLGRSGCILSGGKVMINMAPVGKPIIAGDVLSPIFNSLMKVPSGLVDIAGLSYHFIRLQPNPDLDLHFFIFSPQQEEFSFLYAFQNKAREILKTAMLDRRLLEVMTVIVLWILLLDVSRKITGPITALTAALRHVKQGRWDLIQMPKISFKRKNEIRQLFDSFHDMVEGMKEKEKITGILNKVVSEEVAKEILKSDVQLGGEERIVTMLFSDIRGFTKLTQNMPPHEVIGFLNRCMTKISSVVEDNKGVIDKYMGDGLMALYGAPIAYENSPLHAIVSGLEIVNALKLWNQERIRDRLDPIYVGIGIHTGSVFVGNMGAQNRLNYTVIGSHVNLASRLCAAAGPEEVLITEDTYLQPSVKESVEVEDKGLMSFKGFDEKKQVFKVLRLRTNDANKLLMTEGKEND
jgi:class 3 adenylate cyclase